MSRSPVKKRSGRKLDEAALIRRLAGTLPLSSAARNARVTAWLAETEASAAGKALATLNAGHPALRDLLASVADTAPYPWDLIRADPAGFAGLVTSDPDSALAALLAKAQAQCCGGARQPVLMRVLRRMEAQAALLIALADIGGVWRVARVTRALTDMADMVSAPPSIICFATPCAAASSCPATKTIPNKAPATSCWPWARWAPTS